MEVRRGQSAKQWLFAAWLAAVVFVFPIPHTIALRNLLLLCGVVALVWACRKSLPKPTPWLKPAAWCLIALTSWIAFHSVAVAPSPTLALDHFRANWLMPLLLGGIAAWAAMQLPRERAMQTVIAALAAHMVWLLGWQFYLWLGPAVGPFKATPFSWPFKATPFGAYDFQGTLSNLLLALLLADRVAWARERYSPLALGRLSGWALLLLALISDLALRSRNSTVISIAMIIAAGLVALNAQSRHWRSVVVLIGLVALLGIGSVKFDHRWQGLQESISVGWSSPSTAWMTADEKTWFTTTWPATPSGGPLEFSAYFRSAMARQSIDFIADHPLGIGFGHDAFGRAMALTHGQTGLGSSHSGWLDFALGTGLPGLVLLLATAGVAIRSAWKQFRAQQDAQALMFAFSVGGYTLRCLLDGHLSGWRLGLFAFIVGIVINGMKNPRTEP